MSSVEWEIFFTAMYNAVRGPFFIDSNFNVVTGVISSTLTGSLLKCEPAGDKTGLVTNISNGDIYVDYYSQASKSSGVYSPGDTIATVYGNFQVIIAHTNQNIRIPYEVAFSFATSGHCRNAILSENEASYNFNQPSQGSTLTGSKLALYSLSFSTNWNDYIQNATNFAGTIKWYGYPGGSGATADWHIFDASSQLPKNNSTNMQFGIAFAIPEPPAASKPIYVGVNGKAREVTDMYVGVNGKARKVTAVYVGVNGKAREVF